MIPLPVPLIRLLRHLAENGIKPVLVGGFVRDYFTNHKTLDLDIELYRSDNLESIEKLLSPFGKINEVGKSFGVLKLSYEGFQIDFSPPRLESKRGTGHKGFEITCVDQIDFETAARRRDFTVNAIGYDPIEEVFLDPFGGIEDLRDKRLSCVDPSTFVDDPLRVLRAVQFAARFELTCDPELLILCSDMIRNGALNELPKERIFEEFKKLLLLSRRPSLGLALLREMGGLPLFSPLDKLETTMQDPLSHPEGDVWTHTLMSVDAMAERLRGESRRDLILMFAVLLHDIAKPFTTVIENGRPSAPHHAETGESVAERWLFRITEDKSLIRAVLPLVRYHGLPRKLFRDNAGESEILRLSRQVCIEDLILVAEADFYGRTFVDAKPEYFEAGEWLYTLAGELGVLKAPPVPMIMGRDLISLGISPSEKFKFILETAYEAQLDRVFITQKQGLEWVRQNLVTEL